QSQFFPFVLAHLMERQHVDALNISLLGAEGRNVSDIIRVIGQSGHEHKTHPDRTLARRQPASKSECWSVVFAGDISMPIGIPSFDVEQNEIDLFQFVVAQTISEKAVRIERRVDSHLFGGREQSHNKAVLHQRLASTYRQPSGHHLKSVTILL